MPLLLTSSSPPPLLSFSSSPPQLLLLSSSLPPHQLTSSPQHLFTTSLKFLLTSYISPPLHFSIRIHHRLIFTTISLFLHLLFTSSYRAL